VLAIFLGGVMLAVLVYVIGQPKPSVAQSATPLNLSAPTVADSDTLAILGRSLFVDHLWSVEIAAVLLLVATFGTILIALQTREERE
jgi:NADH:ubiquinone oxidoreductase subunit 6 (subunit J)